MSSAQPLAGKVALVAGATRGAGRAFAVELGRAGATVYCTGRSTRGSRSEVDRAETIDETAELVTERGGTGIAVRVDHLVPDEVRELVRRIDTERGRLDILINDVWGGEHLIEFDKKLWELNLDRGLHMLRLGIDTHAITSFYAMPLMIRRPGGLVVEVTDGTTESNADYRDSFFYDVVKYAPFRMAMGLAKELKDYGGTAVALTPGFLRSEQMLDHFGVTEDNWRDAIAEEPHFCISESPAFVARGAAALAADPDVNRWTGQSLSSGQLAKEYGFTDADGTRPDGWRYFQEVVFGSANDRAGDDTGYR